MNHINLDNDEIKSFISEAHWNKVGIAPTNEKPTVVEESAEVAQEEEEVLEEDEELTLDDLEALLSVFPDNVLEEHAISMAEVLNEAFEESQGDLVAEEYDEDEEEGDSIGDLVDSIVDQTLEDLTDEEE